jgi:hypothetical protein
MFIPVRFYWVRRYRWLKMHGGDAGVSAPKETKALVEAKV